MIEKNGRNRSWFVTNKIRKSQKMFSSGWQLLELVCLVFIWSMLKDSAVMVESFVIGKIICTFVIFIIIVPVMHSTFPGTDGTGSGESTRQKWLFILFDFPELIADLIQPDRVDSNREFATTVLSNGRWCSPFLFITFYVYTLYPNHCQLSGVDTTAPERETFRIVSIVSWRFFISFSNPP